MRLLLVFCARSKNGGGGEPVQSWTHRRAHRIVSVIMANDTFRAFRAPVLLFASLLCASCGGRQLSGGDGLPGGQFSGGNGARGTPKVLLFGIDGVRPDVLAEVATPNIDALAAAGWYTDRARTTNPSVSGPSWSSMLTGVWPDKHGVTNNAFTGRDYATYPSFLTRVEAARPELATFAALDWVPLAELDRVSLAELEDDPGPVLPDAIDVREVVNGYDLGWAEADGEIAARAARHLAEADPDAMFVYFGNPDETSHRHASIGAEYRDAIALSDSHVGMVVDAMRARPTYADEDWLVLISTDHGRRADGGHGGDSPEEMIIFILASGPATVDWPDAATSPATAADPTATPSSFIVDVAVTALAHLGIEIEPRWGLDGVPLGESMPGRRDSLPGAATGSSSAN